MDPVASQTSVFDPAAVFAAELDQIEPAVLIETIDAKEMAFELGLWLSGIAGFLETADRLYEAATPQGISSRERVRECRIVHSTLLLCGMLRLRLLAGANASGKPAAGADVAILKSIGQPIRNAIILTEGIVKPGTVGLGEWKAWKSAILQILSDPAVRKFAREHGELPNSNHLPGSVRKILDSRAAPLADEGDLSLVLPRIGLILRFLSVVGRMLRNDEPLKPTLVIFARIYLDSQDLIEHINNRLARFPDEEAELFGALDGASYTASLELKKVFNQELSGLVGVRPAPSVRARIETAYSLLNDSFQQVLTGFVRLVDPGVTAFDLFPNFQIKLDKSLILRDHLWKVLDSVKKAEQKPDKALTDQLKNELVAFLEAALMFLFYKDQETVERFCEEILSTNEKKDLVPILHRFGAYLETLFGQVNMRTVLSDQPFDQGR